MLELYSQGRKREGRGGVYSNQSQLCQRKNSYRDFIHDGEEEAIFILCVYITYRNIKIDKEVRQVSSLGGRVVFGLILFMFLIFLHFCLRIDFFFSILFFF